MYLQQVRFKYIFIYVIYIVMSYGTVIFNKDSTQ